MKTVSALTLKAPPHINPEPAESGDRPGTRRHLLLSRPPPLIKVAILDDHPVVAVGVGAYLESRPGFRVVHRETSARSLLEKLTHSPCEVALVDFYLPLEPWDGVNYLRRLRRYHPGMALITFSAGSRQETQYAAFRAGANGYFAKECGMVLLPEMIRGVLAGKEEFLTVQDGKIRPQQPTHPHAALTTSEVEILRHISLGLSVTQISARLMRSKKTISTHKRRAMRKLQLSDDLSLALYLREKFAE
ncbi:MULTISPECIES: response regulator transcription factor [Achromobacter]|jgi:DNA-binding NarL/FixJ family response regulator|uniref:Capsular synthesis regulator component B n=1 Tax=Achromobacter aegrifaciens TaxID=1287736 RepID=A0AAD2J5A1_ACHAE|nr:MULTISPECIES: response regulator transcription factor [Achromobacter]PTN51954.1 DNA-binding response regulator [Achromobacter xylosoxidans]MDQ1763841.1 response regulator transcription factor [Achromobacter aegrifaciens]MDR7947790.1 response regulator transcription factor [Achromobacter aegrifaciens]RIJ00366.1 DNA-binding response regulator [Achromobacter sp. K91]RSF03024.1 DNA-binding response regulator [Achromobacter aegrifaciens]